MPASRPTGTEPRLPAPLGGPHKLFDGSFVIEFLQIPADLDATVLMRATYLGGHELTTLGKKHPQAPPLHIHFYQAESFIVESGAAGTTTTYETIDTIHTTDGAYTQTAGRATAVPTRSPAGVTVIPPYVPHTFWPSVAGPRTSLPREKTNAKHSVSPEHPFWATTAGQDYERTLPSGRHTDTTLLIWGHPKTNTGPPTGTLTSDFPPDMDAAFFLALLSVVDAVHGQRLSMSPSVGAALMTTQTASGAAMILAPRAWWLGPLRWAIPWALQVALEWTRKLVDRRSVVHLVEEAIAREVVRKR
ncbi:uncharacterized protein BP01DRAFT_365636 [Aspergillus saccharolyticus JOP 1030-1]|uniref:Uncharacterized protein n=1 Tax=Aspergillus saccharolyticus JOP 1030-1 TaxID=1450539 RepID=A0A318ZGT0_9EURO|nr:hypothetical protein BP01DRAFT_365636 [Aspergillus saccharolyticus JOP 1030-1]PYH45574.1 hypothetical protein BP01DRAFT_365636 [Aspergillus saccharolyticus JOP 1030-1]